MSVVKETHVEQIRAVEDVPSPAEKVDVYWDHATITPPAAKWPTTPEPLKSDLVTWWFTILFDVALIVIPLALFAKVGLVIVAWKQAKDLYGVDVNDQVDALTTYLIRFNGRLVTLFTIVFVTIMSTFVRRYALWKAQRGAYVTDLEQLQGSISLVSTLKLIWSLRAFTVKSFALAVVWTFYWFGSQASGEEYQLVQSIPWQKQYGAILQPGAMSAFSSEFINSPAATYFDPRSMYTPLTRVEDMYLWNANTADGTSYVYAHGRQPPLFKGIDPDGFAAIPSLSCALGRGCSTLDGVKVDRHGWMEAPKSHATTGSYATMVGYPVWSNNSYEPYGADKHLTTTQILTSYQASSSYMDVICGIPSKQPFNAFPNGTLPNQSLSINTTRTLQPAVLDAQGNSLRAFDLWFRYVPDQFNGMTESGSIKWTCNITQVNVDIKVGCTAAGCVVNKIRFTNNTKPQQSISYSTPFDDDALATNLANSLLLFPAPQTNLSYPSPMVKYMTTYLWQSFESAFDPSDPRGVTGMVTEVLSRYINTIYALSQIKAIIYPQVNDLATDKDPSYQIFSFKGALYLPHYAISWPWIALDFVSCGVMLAAAFLAVTFRMQTLAPDILGSVSSLTRDNPYLLLPDSGSTLTGIERARMLKNVKVRLGDISGDNYGQRVGRIGLARVDVDNSEALRVERLRRDIRYV